MSSRMPRDPNLMEKEALAVDLRASGHSYDEIAATLGFRTRSAAYKAVTRAMERRPAQSVDHLRATMGARLDLLNKATFGILASPDTEPDTRLKAVLAAVRIAERQAKLFGLDAKPTPDESQATVTVVFSKELRVDGMSDDDVLEIDP